MTFRARERDYRNKKKKIEIINENRKNYHQLKFKYSDKKRKRIGYLILFLLIGFLVYLVKSR